MTTDPAAQHDLDLAGEPAPLPSDVVTLVEGSSFCVCGRTGDIDANSPQGLFVRDTRLLSSWRLRIGGQQPQLLTAVKPDPFHIRFVARMPPRAGADTELLVERERFVGEGMREDLRLSNLTPEPVVVGIELEIETDFADVFEVKEGRMRARPGTRGDVVDGSLLMSADGRDGRGVRVSCLTGHLRPGGLTLRARVPARSVWSTSVLVTARVEGQDLPMSFPLDKRSEHFEPARRMQSWRRDSPRVTTDDESLYQTLRTSLEDLGALRLFDPHDPSAVAVAAGAPWFMALFGRDSLLTAYMALALDPALAAGTLRSLARHQGIKIDPVTEEEPGRILHETRLGADSSLALGDGRIYYGSADATPLFVVLLGELSRWGLGGDVVSSLLANADRALAWIEEYGDRDGDGFVEYERSTARGLRNQGWKDSGNGINFADGTLPRGPIALCEVQGYVYAAYLARARLAMAQDDPATARLWSDKATLLKRAFDDAFWLPDRGWYAIALDGDKRPVDALTSNSGHCLWSGIVPAERAPQLVDHLVGPEMFSGWGIRTLATSMGAYNPMSYHNGAVWPHDNAIVVSGLMRYGFVEEAQRVATALLDAAAALGGRLPELFSGLTRKEYPQPVPYPTSCSPQAWAAATPIQLMRALVRLEPSLPDRRVWFAPAWPARFGRLLVEGLPLNGTRVRLEAADQERGQLSGLPDDVSLIEDPPPLPGDNEGGL